MSDIKVYRSDIKGEFSAPELSEKYGGNYTFAGMILARCAVDSTVLCDNLFKSSQQLGCRSLDIITEFGGHLVRNGDMVHVSAGKLRGCSVDVTEYPEIAPAAAILALFATGKTHITGFRKKQDELSLLMGNLRSAGVRCEYNENDLWIWPQRSLSHAVFDAKKDAVAAEALIMIASCMKGETAVRNIDGLLREFPAFCETFESLGGKFELCEYTM